MLPISGSHSLPVPHGDKSWLSWLLVTVADRGLHPLATAAKAQDEKAGITVSMSHALDDLNALVEAFELSGLHLSCGWKAWPACFLLFPSSNSRTNIDLHQGN